MLTIRKTQLHRDYHQHSKASDGQLSAADLVRYLKSRGITEFALTNHDTLRDLTEAAVAAREYRIEFITGIELTSCLSPGSRGSDVHVLGYGVASLHKLLPRPFNLHRELRHIQQSQKERIEQQCAESRHDPIDIEKKDGSSLALWISFEQLRTFSREQEKPLGESGLSYLNDGVMCLPLAARVNRFLGITDPKDGINIYLLVNLLKGYASHYGLMQKFLAPFGATLSKHDLEPRRRWLPDNFQPYFIPAERSIGLIREAGGLPVIAHPGETNLSLAEISRLVSWGAKGLEVYSGKHTAEQVEKYLRIAQELDLLMTAGTDFHGEEMSVGTNVGEVLYCPDFPAATIAELKAAIVT